MSFIFLFFKFFFCYIIISFIISFPSYFKAVNNLSILVSSFNNICSLFLTSSSNIFISFITTLASILNSISSSYLFDLLKYTLVKISNDPILHFFQFIFHLTVFLLFLLFHLFQILEALLDLLALLIF